MSWAIARRMGLAWVVTLPAAASAAAVYGVTRLPLPGAAAALAVIGALGLIGGYRAWRGAARPTDIAREVAQRYGRIRPAPASA